MKRLSLLAALASAAAVLSACGPSSPSKTAGGKPVIVTTTTMVTDLVKQLAGDDAEVLPLMGPGVDPHLFKPGHDDIARLQKADVIVYSGLHLEGRMTEILERLGQSGKSVITVADGLPQDRIIRDGTAPDPHIWGDASLWAEGAKHTGEKLAAALPAAAEKIRPRAAAVLQELADTQTRLLAAANSLPPERRVMITSHDAFHYFGRAYGFEVVGVQGISTVSEAALSEITRISDLIKARGVPAIFTESSVSAATIERISRDSGAKLGGLLFSDALGLPGQTHAIGDRTVDTGTVTGMLEANMDTVVTALK